MAGLNRFKIENNNAPCLKDYPEVWTNTIAFDDSSMCDSCCHNIESLKAQLQHIPHLNHINLKFTLEFSSKEWNVPALQFTAYEKVELLLKEVENYLKEVCFYTILTHSSLEITT